MRILLHIVFFFFIILVLLEDGIRAVLKAGVTLIQAIKHAVLRLRNGIKDTGISVKKSVQKTLRKTKRRLGFLSLPRFMKKTRFGKKKKRTTIFSLPFKAKLKYFVFGILFSSVFLFLPLVGFIFIQELPSPHQLSLRQIPQTTKLYDRNGVLLTEIYSSQNRTLISLSDVPKSLQLATLAIEDKNFYNHPGFDLPSILRAFRESIFKGNIQGGSTITQQLIKSSMLTPEQKLSRKAKELILAFWAEHIYTKDEILEMYFNQVPYGGTAWGAEAAAETYFNKSVKELDLAESAFLAGLTSAPSYFSPYGNYPNAWKARQKEVLSRMVALDFITQKQADEAAKEELTFRTPQRAIHAPHFVEYAKEELINRYGLAMVEKGGLQVRTTIDVKVQEMAEKAVREEVEKAGELRFTNGAAVVTDPRNGDVLAMVGSYNFEDPKIGNVNIATSLRQPGSTVKVITYSAALSRGFTAATMIEDTATTFGGTYTPVNYDGRYYGRVPLRFALANSLNVTAVKTLDKVGVDTMVELAKDMGVKSWGNPDQYGLSITLGAAEATMLDMARVNGVLANKGRLVDVNPFLKITDVKGNIIEQKHHETGRKVLDEGVAFIMSDILADNNARSTAFGPNSPLKIPGHKVSVKTGTSDNKRDNWTDGYTSNYVVIVWVGNNDNTPMSPVLASGITGAAPIWNKIMTNLLKGKKEQGVEQPKEVVRKLCLGKQEYFIKGTENSVNCGYVNPPNKTYSTR